MEQQPPQQRINLASTSGCICSKCSNNTFTEVFLLRKISKFVTGASTDGHIPIPIFICTSCSTPYEGTLAPEVKALFSTAVPDVDMTEIEGQEPQPQAKVIQMFP